MHHLFSVFRAADGRSRKLKPVRLDERRKTVSILFLCDNCWRAIYAEKQLMRMAERCGVGARLLVLSAGRSIHVMLRSSHPQPGWTEASRLWIIPTIHSWRLGGVNAAESSLHSGLSRCATARLRCTC